MTREASPHLTRSAEDYLKTIYHLSPDGQAVTTTALAQALDVAPASVTGMVKRLAERGWLSHAPYRGVALTDEGRGVALRMLRTHRVIETYLVARLGYTWDTVHDEAERLEHAASEALIERMSQALGHPEVDPHGDPIPASDGTITELAWVPLADLVSGESAEVRRVRTSDGERLRYLATAGLMPNSRLTVRGREPFDGPIALTTSTGTPVIGADLARLVLCARRP